MFTIYGRNGCPWCTKAEELLSFVKLPYVYRNMSTSTEHREWFDNQGFRKVPQVFYLGAHIGGFTDLVTYLREDGYNFDEGNIPVLKQP